MEFALKLLRQLAGIILKEGIFLFPEFFGNVCTF
jgi:hypothetical protein